MSSLHGLLLLWLVEGQTSACWQINVHLAQLCEWVLRSLLGLRLLLGLLLGLLHHRLESWLLSSLVCLRSFRRLESKVEVVGLCSRKCIPVHIGVRLLRLLRLLRPKRTHQVSKWICLSLRLASLHELGLWELGRRLWRYRFSANVSVRVRVCKEIK